MDIAYPSSPIQQANIPVSGTFRKQVAKVVASIVFFCLVYVVLMIAIFALALAAGYFGLFVIMAKPGWLTLLLGAGVIATGVSLLYFIVKFIGTVNKKNNSGNIQIYRGDHPALFMFLEKVAAETGTIFPKKVFISPDVNAAVFYNSSFLSMLFPVKKNLEIGLGLVNCVNLSEFKAIVAHEFGHFSQRSMKVGSFTYNVNLVLYNILYENTTYGNFLQQWGSLHGLLALFASITVKISQFIQWILRGMYKLINKEYSALRREMEFHADGIAASVAGGNNLVSALSKLEAAEACYQKAIQDANEWLGKNKQVSNIFEHQQLIMRDLGKQFGFTIKNGVSDITYEFARSFNTSRINLKNQWASHPSLSERKDHVDSLRSESAALNNSSWELFNQPEELQKLVTSRLYDNVGNDAERELLTLPEYEQWKSARKESKQLPVKYNGFYDGRYLSLTDGFIEQPEISGVPGTFESIFSEENGKMQSNIITILGDIATVEGIRNKSMEVKSFDFDGQRFAVSDADMVMETLNTDLQNLIKKQEQLDKDAYGYFYLHADDKEELKRRYKEFNKTQAFINEYNAGTEEIYSIFQHIHQTITIEDATIQAEKLKDMDERRIKPAIQQITDNQIITRESNAELYEKMTAFQSRSYHYFFDNSFLDNELEELFVLNDKIRTELDGYLFNQYKVMLEAQLRYAD